MPITVSCHFWDRKALLVVSMTRVRSAVKSSLPDLYTFYFIIAGQIGGLSPCNHRVRPRALLFSAHWLQYEEWHLRQRRPAEQRDRITGLWQCHLVRFFRTPGRSLWSAYLRHRGINSVNRLQTFECVVGYLPETRNPRKCTLFDNILFCFAEALFWLAKHLLIPMKHLTSTHFKLCFNLCFSLLVSHLGA